MIDFVKKLESKEKLTFEESKSLFSNIMEGKFQEAAIINDLLMPLHAALFIESSPGPVKYAANRLGLCSSEIRLPLTEISNETKKTVEQALKHASLI